MTRTLILAYFRWGGKEGGGDSTHGSLALKAYQQNLYLEYYY